MTDTSIEWCARPGTRARTWNPTRGCKPISPGCAYCYAMKLAHRFSGKGKPYAGLTVLKSNGPVWTGDGRFVDDMLDAPLRWRQPSTIFVNSMSDLFYEEFNDEQIAAVFGVMAACPRHTFIVLTKRARRMREWFERMQTGVDHLAIEAIDSHVAACVQSARDFGVELGTVSAPWPLGTVSAPWPLPNVWILVSVEDQERAEERIPELARTPAFVRGVSAEPLLEHVDLSPWMRPLRRGEINKHGAEILEGRPSLDWIIVGGESGPGARRFDLAWAERIVLEGALADVPVFVKQLGRRPWSAGHALELTDIKGGDPSEWPEELRVREWPKGQEVRS